MDRGLFKSSLMILSCCWSMSSFATGGTLVYDPTAVARLMETLKIAQDSLTQLREATNVLQEMNTVLGSRLDPSFVRSLGQFDGASSDFSELLSAVQGEGGDPLKMAHDTARRYGSSADFSNYLYAKDYIKARFFPEAASVTPPQIEAIQAHKMDAVQNSTVQSLALAAQQKQRLHKEHQNLSRLTQQGGQNHTLTYQTSIQTKLLEQIAHRLDQLILLQAQQLELMASLSAGMQPSIYRQVGGTTAQRSGGR